MLPRSRNDQLAPANLTAAEARDALPKLKQLLKVVEAFEPEEISTRDDPQIEEIELRLKTVINNLYPPGTVEHNLYIHRATCLDTAGHNITHGTPISEVVAGLNRGKGRVLSSLNVIIDNIAPIAGEGEVTSQGQRIQNAFKALALHPEIDRAASKLYNDEHYANAVEDAIKALNNLVRLRARLSEDGTKLMEKAFGGDSPKLAFNSLTDESDRSEQQGFKEMFRGAVLGLRNPRAHRLIRDDPERALELIAYVSLLAKLVDQASER